MANEVTVTVKLTVGELDALRAMIQRDRAATFNRQGLSVGEQARIDWEQERLSTIFNVTWTKG